MQREPREHDDDPRGGADVPAHPLVQVEIDLDGAVLVNGRPEPHDVAARHAEAPRELALVAVRAVARDYAMPLGRPVRVLATTPEEQTRLVVHPDGEVAGVEPHLASAVAATPEGVPPATRAQHWLAAREADRVAEAAAQRRSRRRRSPGALRPAVLGVAAAAVLGAGGALALGAGLLGTDADERGDGGGGTAIAGGASSPDSGPDTSGAGGGTARTDPYEPLPAPRLEPLPLAAVRASSTSPGEVRLALRSTRGTPVFVALSPARAEAVAARTGAAQRLDLALRRATTREVVISDLPPGAWVWTVRAPGQEVLRGRVQVPAPPPVAPVGDPVPPVEEPPPATPEPPSADPEPPRGGDGEDRGDGGARPPSIGGGPDGDAPQVPQPTAPVDPRP